MTNNTKILLTGGTGFLGTGLLHYFDYKSFEGSIYLLIRDKKDKTALSRFNEIKKQFHNLKLSLVTVSLLDIDSFVLDVDCIINCAASIEFTLPLEDALKQNVDGLKNLIEFAKKNEVKEGKPEEKEADYGDDYQDMVKRVGQKAKQQELAKKKQEEKPKELDESTEQLNKIIKLSGYKK